VFLTGDIFSSETDGYTNNIENAMNFLEQERCEIVLSTSFRLDREYLKFFVYFEYFE
jgi:hypothetical protein